MTRVKHRLRGRLLTGLLDCLFRTMAGYGYCLGLAPELNPPRPDPPRPSRSLVLLLAGRGGGPPDRHPERLRPDLPLTPVEQRLARELRLGPERS